MSKKNQMETVYNIVKFNQPVRTEQVKILAMQAGISCGDRYLRWLKHDGYVSDKKFENDNTKTWYVTDKVFEKKKARPVVVQTAADQTGQLCMKGMEGISEKSANFAGAMKFACLFMIIFFIFIFETPGIADTSTGKNMTKIFEGYRSRVYICPAGARTIGYGFNIEDPRVKKLIPSRVLSGRVAFEKHDAERVFDALYAEAQKDSIKFIGHHNFLRLPQRRKDIIIDMAYNLGLKRLMKFKKLQAAIIAKDYDRASAEMKDSKWYRQTGRRAKHHVRNFKE